MEPEKRVVSWARPVYRVLEQEKARANSGWTGWGGQSSAGPGNVRWPEDILVVCESVRPPPHTHTPQTLQHTVQADPLEERGAADTESHLTDINTVAEVRE